MSAQRKYIILIFLVFTLLFIGIYFIPNFFSAKNQRTDAIGEIYPSNTDTSKQYKDGKLFFQNKCASCHILFKDFTGPDLIGLTKRGPWGDKKNILEYLRNPEKFIEKDDYIRALKKKYVVNSQIFLLSEKEIDDFVYYIESEEKNRKIQSSN